MIQEKLKGMLFDIKIFVPYLLRRFFYSFVYLFKGMQSRTEELNRTFIWVKISIVMTILFFVLGKYQAAVIWVVVGILAGLRHEWIDGRFRREHIEELRKRAKKQMELDEIKKQ